MNYMRCSEATSGTPTVVLGGDMQSARRCRQKPGARPGVTLHVDVASIQPLEKARNVTTVEAEFTGPAIVSYTTVRLSRRSPY